MKVRAKYAAFTGHAPPGDFLSVGWMPDPALEGCYRPAAPGPALVVWVCDCAKRRPASAPQPAMPRPPVFVDLLQREVQIDHDEEREFGWGVR